MLDILTDLQVEEHEKRIKELEEQIELLKKYIEDKFGSLEEWIEKKNGQIMTTQESEYYIKKIEMYSDVFSYGRVEEKKMAESL